MKFKGVLCYNNQSNLHVFSAFYQNLNSHQKKSYRKSVLYDQEDPTALQYLLCLFDLLATCAEVIFRQ